MDLLLSPLGNNDKRLGRRNIKFLSFRRNRLRGNAAFAVASSLRGIHALPYTALRASRDATKPTAECYPGWCPVSKVQFFVARASSSLSLNRASRKIYLKTVTIIRTAADVARRDGCESFRVERIVSRPFHGRSARPSKFFGEQTGTSPEWIFPRRTRKSAAMRERERERERERDKTASDRTRSNDHPSNN